MTSWLKEKYSKVFNTQDQELNIIENNYKEEISGDTLLGLKEEVTIRHWIDMAAHFDNNNLILKGWCLDNEQHVSVSVSSNDGTSAHLIHSRREKRDDVLSHLNLGELSLEPGFVKIYDVEHAEGELILTFKSDSQELSVPLVETDATQEQLQSIWNEFYSEEAEAEAEAEVTENIEQQLIAEQERWLELEALNPVKHYIEKVGVYNNKVLLVRGWCVDIESDDSIVVTATKDSKPLRVLKYIKRERRDVAVSFGLTDDKAEYGFLMLLELASSVDKDFTLTFANNTHTKELVQKEFDAVCKEELEQNLIDTNEFTSASAKLFLIESLGRSYLADIETKFVGLPHLKANLHLEAGFALKTGCFLRGWIDDFNSNLAAICLTDGSKISENLLPILVRKVRSDVNDAFEHLPDSFESGFFCYGELGAYKKPVSMLFIETSGSVASMPLNLKVIENDEITATQHILADVDPRSSDCSDIYANHISPALLSVWADRTTLPSVSEVDVHSYGAEVIDPICSIIVPLYGRFDFVLHQISQFESDIDFTQVELIYVIDDPRIEKATKTMCEDISKMYSTSFKVVTCGRNLGFAGANNLGVLFAQSEHLLLLNSDVIPSESGWLTRMLDQYKNTPDIGALGVKLVYEDESIQHIGMKFVESNEFGHLWLNDHHFKGLPETLIPKVEFEKIPTVTAACLMLEKSKFDAVGGFDTSYILGDFEDSDLCLKLLSAGYDNYILGTEKLYHLERQSQSLVDQGDWKFKLTLFNGWQHTLLWDSLISRLQA
ncbi:glycosyltransferase [Vibrio sp. FNV 38]|nr:glycosyltransferase [Vibrio sp. FNV 38]